MIDMTANSNYSVRKGRSNRGRRSNHPSKDMDRLFLEANRAWDIGELDRAFRLFMQAATMGDASSQLDLGYFYDKGLYVRKNKKMAIRWYRKAYAQGHPGGANNIATVYRELGDTRRMLWWFRRAAAMGDPDVLLDLGKRYEAGLAVPKDVAKAKRCYRGVFQSRFASKDDRAEARDRLANLKE